MSISELFFANASTFKVFLFLRTNSSNEIFFFSLSKHKSAALVLQEVALIIVYKCTISLGTTNCL